MKRHTSEPLVPNDTKWAFTTRRVRREDVERLYGHVATARAGDLVLAEVTFIGQHKRLQLPEGRGSHLYLGDRVVVACGARYAPDYFEAIATVDPAGSDLVAAGGLAGSVRAAHDRTNPPTRLKPLALLADGEGAVLNLERYGLPPSTPPKTRPPVICVLGTEMNAGKTTTAAALCHGLKRAGLRIGAGKLTGTGAFNDFNAYLDAGVADVLDFTDAGLASTYKVSVDRLEEVAGTLIGHLAHRGAEAIVLELADGALQGETAALMHSPTFRSLCDGVAFAASGALGAVAGIRSVSDAGLKVLAVSGLVTRSPLALRELQSLVDVPCLSRNAMMDPLEATRILGAATGSPVHALTPVINAA